MSGNQPPAKCFQDLQVWHKAHQYVLGIYILTATFPKQETYCLTTQMRRAAVSIPANIAEGFRKRGRADKARFMNIAEGSWKKAATTSSLHRTWATETPPNSVTT